MKEDSEKIAAVKERKTARPETDGKTVLVTIHGTGAGEPTEEEDSWWLEGGRFLGKLKERLDLDPSRVEIFPFLWDGGPNSEASRRQAGRRLYELLKSYDAAGNNYYLICHSHGGSVAYSALLQSVDEDQPLERLKCWCTVGTPFLEYKRNKYLWQRLGGWQLWLYVMSATTSLFAPLLLLLPLIGIELSSSAESRSETLLFLSPWPLMHGCFLLLERYKARASSKSSLSWITEKQKETVEHRYSESWVGLCHPQDEAVSALSNIKDVNEEIVKHRFLLPLIPISQFLLIIVWRFTPLDTFTWEWLEEKLEYHFLLERVLYVVLLLGIIIGLGFFLKGIALSVGKPISRWVNNAVWSSVRENVWGDDVNQEDVISIEAYPPNFEGKFKVMPDAIANSLNEHSSKSAIRTLVKVREILGMTKKINKDGSDTEMGKGAMDIRSDLSQSLTWEELIHTSYFDVDSLIDLIAFGLHRAGIAEFKESFILTPENELLKAWHDDNTSLGKAN
jgi:hypothetical protein